MIKNIIRKTPIPTGGLALGLASLGNLLHPFSEIIHWICGSLSCLLLLVLTIKCIIYPKMIRADLHNSIFASVGATSTMAAMVLTTYFVDLNYWAAFLVWCSAVVVHFAMMAFFIARYFPKFDLKEVFPTYFIAFVGVAVVGLTAPDFGSEIIGQIAFWIALVGYAITLVLVTLRYIKHPVPEGARPLFCIYAAPSNLLLATFFALDLQNHLFLVEILLISGQFFLIMVCIKAWRFLFYKFYPSFAAMTFPFAITAISLTQSINYFAEQGASTGLLELLHALSVAETALATFFVIYAFIRYMIFFLTNNKG